MIFLGVDTSNYTTSVCAYECGEITSCRRILDVQVGERGLRQSDGVFQHMKNLPELYEELCAKVDASRIAAVGVSTRPRSVDGSYMPVFLAGEGYARVVARTLSVPLYRFSHQDGHIMAGIESCGAYELLDNDFISVHLSGGTTEILRSAYTGSGFQNEIIGGTKDISAGQFIDRVGVALKMRFPAGVHMEKLADTTSDRRSLPVKTDGAWMNLSGVETKATRMAAELEEKNERAALARGVLFEIRKALTKTIGAAIRQTGLKNVLIAGGVASNQIIREGLQSLPYKVYFASKEFSTDNAMGVAKLAELSYGSSDRYGITDK